MSRKTRNIVRRLACLSVAGLILSNQGCATPAKTSWRYYLQREPVSVLVMPCGNTTEHPDAAVIFNKTCEEALRNKGFLVIGADNVVTYAASRGVLLTDIARLKPGELGKDLKADMILYSEITEWEATYSVIDAKASVSGSARLVETSTEALVSCKDWHQETDSGSNNSSGNPVADLLAIGIKAAARAVAHSAFDACASLGEDAAKKTIAALPQPGFAPAGLREQSR